MDAVLDANVLFPASLRDTLLRAAAADLYRPHWTDDILEEVRRNLVAKRISDDQARRLITHMSVAFPDAIVAAHQALISAMTNDPKDRHVLAAAVASKSEIIITFNLRDFPAYALAPLQIDAQSPDAFLSDLLTLDADRMIAVMNDQAADLRHPPKTLPELLDTLAQHAPSFVAAVRSRIAS